MKEKYCSDEVHTLRIGGDCVWSILGEYEHRTASTRTSRARHGAPKAWHDSRIRLQSPPALHPQITVTGKWRSDHNKHPARFWAIALVLFCGFGLPEFLSTRFRSPLITLTLSPSVPDSQYRSAEQSGTEPALVPRHCALVVNR